MICIELPSVNAVIDALGGTKAVAELTKRGATAPCNWRRRQMFPPATFPVLMSALEAIDHTAPKHLWWKP